MSDVDVPGVPTIPLSHDWPGWWAKLELFRPDITDDLLFFDLDTVVFSVDGLNVGVTTMLSDFYRPDRPASGLMYLKHSDKAAVWGAFIRDPDKNMAECSTPACWGDQGFISKHLNCKRWQDLLPDTIYSYKKDIRGGRVPAGAKVVCFHGQPSPWKVKADWIPK